MVQNIAVWNIIFYLRCGLNSWSVTFCSIAEKFTVWGQQQNSHGYWKDGDIWLKIERDSILIKIQPDATVCRYLFTATSLYMFRVSQHLSSGVLKTVTAASGTGHNTGTDTSLQFPFCLFKWMLPTYGPNVNKNPTRCNSMQIFIYCKVTLHVSGVTAPIIRSTKNCNRSLRYRS